MTIAKHIKTKITGSSWIRKMFEEGALLKAEHGDDNVFDFSLGNPNLEPPGIFREVLKNTVMSLTGTDHGYMPNTGYPHVRRSVAEYLSKEQQAQITENDVIMTCGAAGALNVILKVILDPGDEVITPAPYFVEYHFYTEVYSKESLDDLGALLKEKGKRLDRTLYLIADEPYRKVVYDGHSIPSIFKSYNESIIATSYSKDISIPGERIGYLAVHPDASFNKELMEGMALANRILGFVNAPALMQRVVASLQGASVDISYYARKRDLLCNGLADCGYDFIEPPGAFYLFPKTPIPDDVEFVKELQKELILTVPGSGFGGPGHFRIAYCVEDRTITDAMPGFDRVMKKYR
jgi:aspartate aminotransferase